MIAATDLRELAERTTAERESPANRRTSGADDDALVSVARMLELAAGRLDADDRAGARDQLDQAAHLVGDTWSFRSQLGQDILGAAEALR